MIYKAPAKFFAVSSSIGLSLLLALSMLISIATIHPQNAYAATPAAYAYTKTFDTTNGYAFGYSVATDTSDNIYLSGIFAGTVIFDGVSGSDSQTDAGNSNGAFLTKYNANGTYAYTKTFDTTDGYAYGYGVTTDTNDNIYLAGGFGGTVIFDGVGGSDSQTAIDDDAFLTKYNANGTYAYTKTFDVTNGYASAYSVTTDTSGNTYLTGEFGGTVIFDGAGGSDSQTDAGGNSGTFLTKYNANGTYAYTKTFDTADGYAYGRSVTTDTNGNIYLTGLFVNTVIFDGVGGSDSQTAINNNTFLTRYNTNGTYAYTKTFDTIDGATSGTSITTDTSGNIYLTGFFSGTVIFDGVGGSDSQITPGDNTFLTKYNANGTYAYTKTFDVDTGHARGRSVTTDTSGNTYLTGEFGGTVIFDGAGGSDSQTDIGGNDNTFLTKYNANGTYAYTKTFDTTDGNASGTSVVTDTSSNIYLAGYFTSTVIFDGVGGSDSQTDAGVLYDAFLTKYSPAPVNNPGNPTPSAPDTGFGVFITNPLRTLAIYSLVSLGLAALAVTSRRFTK